MISGPDLLKVPESKNIYCTKLITPEKKYSLIYLYILHNQRTLLKMYSMFILMNIKYGILHIIEY